MSQTVSANNQRIAKNTLMLYIRMFLVMIVSLYTVRVVLQILGKEDYGIYNVVGGIVVMFSFLSRTLAGASQRYFAFEIGRGDHDRLKKVFSITLLLYLIVTVVIAILAETLGLWYLHYKMNIPDGRMFAADWVFQFSVLSFCFTLYTTPHKAMIIANEKMNVYAFVGVLEVVLNLLLVLSLKLVSRVDYLIAYAVLMFLNQVVVNMVYIVYARKHYPESRFQYYWEGGLAKEIASFSGWNFFGSAASVVRSQGINMLISAYFNPAINAARGLAYQVSHALNSFSTNFYTAVRPQVVKYYSQDNLPETLKLVFRSSKMTYFLMFFLAVPVLVFIDPVLELWLKNVPPYTALFSILVIATSLLDSLSHPLMTLAQATGKIRLYQIVVGSLLLANLPVSWIFLALGYGAEYTMYTALAIAMLSVIARLFIIKKVVTFPVKAFCAKVLWPITLSTIASLAVAFVIKLLLYNPFPNIGMLIVSAFLSVCTTVAVIYLTGFEKAERVVLVQWAKNIVKKLKK